MTFGMEWRLTIKCIHGYFMFNETKMGELSDFMNLFTLELVSKNNYYTFPALANAPKYSVEGGNYLDAPALKTFEGEPWEVMKENGLVYNFILKKVVPIESIIQRPNIKEATNYYFSDGLLLPGSVTDDGLRVTDYSAGFLFGSIKFRYTEVSYGQDT